MKTQPEMDANHTLREPGYPEDRGALPALQLYTGESVIPEQRHAHILRAALLDEAWPFTVSCKH
jgi:hypothetical protein